MHHNPTTLHLAPRDCPWTFRGTNIAELRAVPLQRLASRFGVQGELRDDILPRLVTTLRNLSYPPGELVAEPRDGRAELEPGPGEEQHQTGDGAE